MNIDYASVREKVIAWPFKEAERVLKRVKNSTPQKGYVLFETGYGPSGLPHIGTFGEVARTVMVMNALRIIAPSIPMKLIVYSDDMDGLRKIPGNIPNGEQFQSMIGKPVSAIPDPFGEFDSYALYMNNKLRSFLDYFGFEYELYSATENYRAGKYNAMMLNVVRNCDEILRVMKPTLGEERGANYHPILPICQKTGKYVFDGVISCDDDAGTITFKDEFGDIQTISLFDGNAKLQWKIEWAMRWAALGVDYEMHGKDLTPSAVLSSQICKILGAEPPILYVYEMFTDEEGKKISKSKGNGVSVEDWLKFGSLESIALFMYEHPERAKKLHFTTILDNVDKYIKYAKDLKGLEDCQTEEEFIGVLNNPAFHIPLKKRSISKDFYVDFNLILNLASACNPDSSDVLFDYISRYQKSFTEDEKSIIEELIEKALNYYNVFVKPSKQFPSLSDEAKERLVALRNSISVLSSESEEGIFQQNILDVGKKFGYDKSTMRDWFKFLYQNLFGRDSGPKFGSFIKIYGCKNFVKMIDDRLCND